MIRGRLATAAIDNDSPASPLPGRSATSVSGPMAMPNMSRSPATTRITSTTRYMPVIEREPLTDQVKFVFVGGGFAGLARGARLRRPASPISASSSTAAISAAPGTGTAIPASQCDIEAYSTCRCSKRPATCRSEKYADGAEILEHSPAHRPALRPLRQARCSRPQITALRWDEAIERWHVAHRPRRRHPRALRRHGRRPAQPAEAARHPRHRRASRATASTPAAGTTTTPAAAGARRLDKLADKRVAHHRHRRHRDPGACRTSANTPSSSTSSSARLRRSTCAATSRPIRSGRRFARARLAAQRHGELSTRLTGVARPTRTWSATAGPRARQTASAAIAQLQHGERQLDEDDGRLCEIADFQKMNEIRAPRRRRSSRTRDGRALEALVPPFCKRPRFNDDYLQTFNRPTSRWSTPTGKGVERITEKGVVVERRRVRGRLHHLRHRLRGRHRDKRRTASASPAAAATA